jgi:hypothetical protein
MTDDRSLERAARTWLEDGPAVAPDRAVESALVRIETTRQERAPLVPWRMPFMTPAMKLAGAAVLVVAAVAGSLYLFGGGPGGFGDAPTPSPSVAPSEPAGPTSDPTPEATPIDSSAWVEYTSAVYGSIIMHPADWEIFPATEAWDPGLPGEAHTDDFYSDQAGVLISVFTAPVEAGTTLQEWAEALCTTPPCEDLQGRLEPVVRDPVDRYPGVLIGFDDATQAYFPSWASPGASLDAVWTDPAPADAEIYVVAAARPPDEFNAREYVQAFSLNLCAACVEPEVSPSAAP